MEISFARIQQKLPHGSGLVLIDCVTQLSDHHLEALSYRHLGDDHPLSVEEGRIPPSTAIEYAGQAIALHHALTHDCGNQAPRQGMIVRCRNLFWSIDNLKKLPGPLQIRVFQIDQGDPLTTYRYRLSPLEQPSVMEGDLTVYLPPRETP